MAWASPEPMLTKITKIIWRHYAIMSSQTRYDIWVNRREYRNTNKTHIIETTQSVTFGGGIGDMVLNVVVFIDTLRVAISVFVKQTYHLKHSLYAPML